MITLKGVDPRMIANNLTPSEPIHPGEMIKDEIEYRGLSQRKLAEQMGISPTLLNEILNGKRSVSTEYALLFEAALGIDAEIWLRQQGRYDMQKAKSNKSFLERLANIRKLAATLMLYKFRYGRFFILLLVLWSCKLDSKKEPAETFYEVAVLRGPSAIAFAQWMEKEPVLKGKKMQVKVLDSPEQMQALLAGESLGFARTDAGFISER